MQDGAHSVERFFSRKPFHLLLITILGLLVYSMTLDVPFQWDEDVFIADNPIVKDLDYFLSPSDARDMVLYEALKSRYVGYLTFALNYAVDGLNVTGYHLLNITIHLACALLVYALVLLTFRTPFLTGSALASRATLIALFTALLFVAHPVQTEAVTYIFQRLASLVSLFYLLSVVAYLQSRLTAQRPAAWSYYILSMISAFLAMKTKENAFTLPFIIMLYEFLFFDGATGKRLVRLVPLFVIALIIPLSLVGLDRPIGEAVGGLAPAKSDYSGISRKEYLLTEFRVIVTYIRLLLLPVNQNLDYDYPVFRSFSDPSVFLSFVLHLALFGLAIYLFFRSRTKNRAIRIIAFGILWFYITLSVESSIVPIPMVINEYRLYLPSTGIFMAFITAVFLVMEKIRRQAFRNAMIVFLVFLSLILAAVAVKRNSVWQTKVSLWEDVVKKSPDKARPHNGLCLAYLSEGSIDKAIEQCRRAIELKPGYAMAHYNLGYVYESAGFTDKAMEQFLAAIDFKPNYYKAYYNVGKLYESLKLTDTAIEYYRSAIEIKPDFQEAHYNLANAYMLQGRTDMAIEQYLKVVNLSADFPDAYNNLGVAYGRQGMYLEAVESYRRAIALKPDYMPVYFNLAVAYLRMNDRDSARRVYEQLKNLDPQLAERLGNIISQ